MKDVLDKWRGQIDELDDQLLDLLAKRTNVVRKIGKFKRTRNIKPLDEKRWEDLLKSKLSKADSLSLPSGFVKKLYSVIHKHSLEVENESK